MKITLKTVKYSSNQISMFEAWVRNGIAHSKAYKLTDCQHRILIDCILEEFSQTETVNVSDSLQKLGFPMKSEHSEMHFSEFLSTLAERLKSFPSRHAIEKCFRTYDDNHDGKLDLHEATELIQRIYQASSDNEGSTEDIAERFSNIDIDHNGKIDIDEMYDFMKKLFIFKPFDLKALHKVAEENQRKLIRDTVPTQIADLIYQILTSGLLYYIWIQHAPDEWKDFVHNVYLSGTSHSLLYKYCILMVVACAVMILKNVLPMYLFEVKQNDGFV